MSDTLELQSENETGLELKFVRFQLADEQFAFPVDSVTGIINWREVTPLPNVDEHLLGLANLRGRTLPVSDLRVQIGLQSSVAKQDAFIIVFEKNQTQVGMLVDEVLEVLTVKEEDIQTDHAESNLVMHELIQGIVNVDDVLISILDVDSMLGGVA